MRPQYWLEAVVPAHDSHQGSGVRSQTVLYASNKGKGNDSGSHVTEMPARGRRGGRGKDTRLGDIVGEGGVSRTGDRGNPDVDSIDGFYVPF